MTPKARAIEDFTDEYPKGCLKSFIKGWNAAMKAKRNAAANEALIGNKNRWDHKLDPLYEQVKQLVYAGVQVTCACEAVGMSRDSYYRRKRIEVTGRDRV